MWADLAGFILPGPLSGKVTVPLDLFRKQPSGQHSFALHSGARESSSEPGPGLGSISAEVLLGLGWIFYFRKCLGMLISCFGLVAESERPVLLAGYLCLIKRINS